MRDFSSRRNSLSYKFSNSKGAMPCSQTYPVHHSSCADGGTRDEWDGGTVTFVDEVLSMAEMIVKRPVAYKNEPAGRLG
jgi:hypothetical protein